MKAIVLTCDKYRALTDHMIFKYEQCWPTHPFRFRVPYQDSAPTMPIDRVEYIKTPRQIKSTVLRLLDDLDDEEMVYWCIDDKYPIKINLPRLERLFQWLAKESAPEVCGVLFCRCRHMWESRYLTGQAILDDQGNMYLERKGYEQIWIHQFLRVKVLRHLFESFPDEIPTARSMDSLKRKVPKPAAHHIFVSRQNLGIFGESTSYGMVTSNCYRSIRKNGLVLPEWCSQVTKRDIVIGTWTQNIGSRLRNTLARLMGRSN